MTVSQNSSPEKVPGSSESDVSSESTSSVSSEEAEKVDLPEHHVLAGAVIQEFQKLRDEVGGYLEAHFKLDGSAHLYVPDWKRKCWVRAVLSKKRQKRLRRR